MKIKKEVLTKFQNTEKTSDSDTGLGSSYLLILTTRLILSLIFLCSGVYKPVHPLKAFTLRITADGSKRVLPADDLVKKAEELEEYGGN